MILALLGLVLPPLIIRQQYLWCNPRNLNSADCWGAQVLFYSRGAHISEQQRGDGTEHDERFGHHLGISVPDTFGAVPSLPGLGQPCPHPTARGCILPPVISKSKYLITRITLRCKGNVCPKYFCPHFPHPSEVSNVSLPIATIFNKPAPQM